MRGAIKNPEWTKEEEIKVVELRKKLVDLDEIAKQFNRSKLGILFRLKKLLSSKERKEIDKQYKKSKRSRNWDNEEERKQYEHNWYLQHKEEVLTRGQRFVQKRTKEYNEYKKTLTCKDCGNSDYRVITFHHLDPKMKENVISNMITSSRIKFEIEIGKCIPLCANCHAIRHYEEIGV